MVVGKMSVTLRSRPSPMVPQYTLPLCQPASLAAWPYLSAHPTPAYPRPSPKPDTPRKYEPSHSVTRVGH